MLPLQTLMGRFFLTALALLVCLDSFALTCMPTDPKDRVAEYDHIFVAFVISAHYEENPAYPDGLIIGLLQPTETLKGNPNLVPGITKPAPRRSGYSIGGIPRDFPVGSYVIVFSNGDFAPIDGCNASARVSYVPNRTCSVDYYRRALEIDHPDSPFCREQEAAARQRALDEYERRKKSTPNK